MRLADGDNGGPIDECRAAWKKRLRLPHAEFEILLARHIGRGISLTERAALPTHDAERDSTESVRAAISAIMGMPPLRSSAKIADMVPDDGLMGRVIAGGMRRCATAVPAADRARTAWALQAVIAGLYDNMPTNLWCSTDVLRDGFCNALEDCKTPFAHHYASELATLQRLENARRLLAAIPVAMRQHETRETNLYHICAYMRNFADANFGAILVDAHNEYAAQMKRSDITPLVPPRRRLHPGPR